MAKVTPPLASIHPLTVGDHAELAMLSRLAHGLSDAFELFHSVDWTQAESMGFVWARAVERLS